MSGTENAPKNAAGATAGAESIAMRIEEAPIIAGGVGGLSGQFGGPPVSKSGPAGVSEMTDLPPEFSEESLALQFAELHASDLRFVSAWGKWLIWTGTFWKFDDTLLHFSRAREICRARSISCQNVRVAGQLASAKTVAAVITLARSDRRLAATVDQWDCSPWLLNTPEAVIDLRSGDRSKHNPNFYLTKITTVGPGGKCPRWHKFLDQITKGDVELQKYLQRVLGYSLTGVTTEHALFFGYGTGANGKSVLLSTVASILGTYHKTAAVETFVASNVEHHPTDLAGLRGARLVTASETEEGRRWAESRIKSLTGGDAIAARFMRQDFFEFVPTFKLFIAGNHKPGLRSVDEAIRRRLHFIPFAVTIPPDQRDPDLTQKLAEEARGILGWMVDGCLAWQERDRDGQESGLRPPQAVRSATDEYLEAEDAIAAWIEEKCDRDVHGWEASSDLFASWKTWAEHAGESAGTMKRFGPQLESRGIRSLRKTHARGFAGVALRRDEMFKPSWDQP